jgi:predicted RNase H-like nuclease (RuvC/YqgF family)
MLQERDSYRSQLNTYERDVTVASPGALNAQQQQQRSRIEALEKTVEGYRELVERLEEDLEKTVRGSGSHRRSEFVVGPLLVP